MELETNLYKEHTASLWMAWFFGILAIILLLLCFYNQHLFINSQEEKEQLKAENVYLQDKNQELEDDKVYIQEKYKLLEEEYISLQEKAKEVLQ